MDELIKYLNDEVFKGESDYAYLDHSLLVLETYTGFKMKFDPMEYEHGEVIGQNKFMTKSELYAWVSNCVQAFRKAKNEHFGH